MPESTRVPPSADALAREVTRLARRSLADRSVLRHSLGKSPKDVALGVHRIVVPFVPQPAGEAAERAYYMVAALIAAQPRNSRDHAGTGKSPEDITEAELSQDSPDGTQRTSAGRRRPNLGYSLAQAADKGANANSLENHLQLLTRQNLDGLYRHLPRLILRLSADQVRIDWGALIHDLTRWAADPRQVAKEWAQDYYRTSERLTAARKRKNEQTAGRHDNEETAS